jgi:DNA-binding response OmpR family regulator
MELLTVGTSINQLHTHTIMLIEDDESIHDFLKFYFGEEGIATLQAWDVDESITLIVECVANNNLPCAILVDCNLSSDSGARLIQYVRNAELRIPIVAMSASRDALNDAVAAGANFTIKKPFDMDHVKFLLVQLCSSQSLRQ